MRRVVAHGIDALVLSVVLLVVWYVASAFVSRVYLPYVNTSVFIGYAVWMESSRGQTLGKQALRLRVRNGDGRTPTVAQAFRRNLYLVLAILPGFIGGLIALAVIGWISAAILVDIDHRQGVHDRFANQTFVTRYTRA